MPTGEELSGSERRAPTCTSCSSTGYWFLLALIAWGVLALIGLAWAPLHGDGWPALLLAAGIGCVGNWRRHRTYHCAITGPLLLGAGLGLLAVASGLAHFRQSVILAPLVIGLVVACVMEQCCARPAPRG